MSNYLAIATVTATLQRTLQTAVQGDVPGARVTTVRPDSSSGGTPDVGVNVYLYQATPNPAWRNADLRNRRPKGELIKQAQAGLDLYYLLTFYGNEVELEPQRLLGSTVRILVDEPILTADMIRETIAYSSLSFLQDSTLADQVDRVTIVPSFLSTDDLSKIWSVFFQTPYMLSFACQGGAVLIEGDKSTARGLPIRSRQFYATPNQPLIQAVLPVAGVNQPIVLESQLMIRGQHLQAESTADQMQTERQRTARRWEQLGLDPIRDSNAAQQRGEPKVLIGEAIVTPAIVKENEIHLQLSQLPDPEQQQLRAGVQTLQVIYPILRSLADGSALSEIEPERKAGSNILAFVLCPTVKDVQIDTLRRDGDLVSAAEITVTVDMNVGSGQRVFLLLNQRSIEKPAAYIFAAQRRPASSPPSGDSTVTHASSSVTFLLRDVKAGDYLVRLQIDGAESPLVYEGEQYVRPRIDLR